MSNRDITGAAGSALRLLARDQGLESNGPRQAFENAFRLGGIEDEFIWAEAMKARNSAVRVCRETFAQASGEN